MQALLDKIQDLQKEIGKDVAKAISAFKGLSARPNEELFKELCFCLLTANYSAEGGIRIQKALGDEFLYLPEAKLATKLKELGHRFPNARAHYITEARKYALVLKGMVALRDGGKVRDWLVENVKGLGYKEASHFLRNIGFDDLAILDFHILDLLEKVGLIERPKTLTRNKYLEIENTLKTLANKAGLTLAELDLYLWYLETGKVLK